MPKKMTSPRLINPTIGVGAPPSKPVTVKKKSNTKRKLKQLPLRFKSPYVCFSLITQKSVARELGSNATANEVAKKIVERWKRLSLEERVVWEETAEREKKRLCAEVASYNAACLQTGQNKQRKIIEKNRSNLNKPKRPVSAYLFYAQEMRPFLKKENPEMTAMEITKLLGELWNNASTPERKRFVELETESRNLYQVAMAEWHKKNGPEPKPKPKRKYVRKKRTPDKSCEPNKVESKAVTPAEPFVIDRVPSTANSGARNTIPHEYFGRSQEETGKDSMHISLLDV